jgi:protein-tyrosine sulfotransferase
LEELVRTAGDLRLAGDGRRAVLTDPGRAPGRGNDGRGLSGSVARGYEVEWSDLVTMNGHGDVLGDGVRGLDPVFVLCMGRSGSTLLRLILDSHPDLACPPETNLPALCSQLAVVWSLIEGAPLSLQRGDAPPMIPEAAIAGIRNTMDRMTAPYLARRGKRRYCDKSLGTARYAELLLRIYPCARFICLFRHPMDVIASGLEACPWGLNGYGFDAYIAGSPGNAVMALARYWHDGASEIAAVEEEHPDRCHRVRYEDMVQDPEGVAARIFGFIGAAPAPGIARAVFARDHERFGPADHKIWHTCAISADSVGRSDAVPVALIPPALLESVNGLLGKLGYATVDEKWGTAEMAAGLLAAAGDAAAGDAVAAAGSAPPPEAGVLADRLAAGLAGVDDAFAGRWQERIGESFTVVIRQPHSRSPVAWRVSLAERAVSSEDDLPASAPGDPRDNGGDADWGMVGSAQAWLEVLDGRANLSVALRRNELRYCDFGDDDSFVAEDRIALLAAFLGLPRWSGYPATASEPVPAVVEGR